MKLRVSGLIATAAAVAGLLGGAQSLAQIAYITNEGFTVPFVGGIVSVIDTASNTVTATIPVGNLPYGVAVTPDGRKVYVTNQGFPGAGSVSVIDTATNTVKATIPVGSGPIGFGIFIEPVFALSPSEVATTASGLAYSRVSRTSNGTVTITNISSITISGPFQILFRG